MLKYNENLQFKYPGAKKENSRIVIPIKVFHSNANIYLENGIWRVKPEFIAEMTGEVLKALDLEPNTKEAAQLRSRIVLVNNLFLFEFWHKDLK